MYRLRVFLRFMPYCALCRRGLRHILRSIVKTWDSHGGLAGPLLHLYIDLLLLKLAPCFRSMMGAPYIAALLWFRKRPTILGFLNFGIHTEKSGPTKRILTAVRHCRAASWLNKAFSSRVILTRRCFSLQYYVAPERIFEHYWHPNVSPNMFCTLTFVLNNVIIVFEHIFWTS